ncbi:MAG: DUF3343 domain-containing protein [Thermodesulfobacteriota bacterium]
MAGQETPTLDGVVILGSIHFVLKAEERLKKAGIRHDVIPVPRRIGSDCGMAIAFGMADLVAVRATLTKAAIAIARLYRKERCGGYSELPIITDEP